MHYPRDDRPPHASYDDGKTPNSNQVYFAPPTLGGEEKRATRLSSTTDFHKSRASCLSNSK